MFFLNKNKKTAPKWFKYGMLAFIAFAVINAMFRAPTEFDRKRAEALQRHQAEGGTPVAMNPYVATTIPSLKDYPEMRKAMDIDRWKRMFDSENVMRVQKRDVKRGEGPTAQCGQQVTVLVNGVRDEDGAAFDPEHDRETPITFRIGDGTQIPAIDQSVVGMRVGGNRSTSAAEHLVYPQEAEGFKMESVRFSFTLLSLEPTVPEGMMAFTRTQRYEKSSGEAKSVARCGDVVTVSLAIADPTGQFAEAQPFTFTVGDPDIPHGLTRSVMGAPVGAEITATIPPSYANMSAGAANYREIFNGEQIVIVRMERTQ